MSVSTTERLKQLNKQLAMYAAFRNAHGAAAVMREIQWLVR